MKQTHFFLGANSAEGFYGLYDQLLDARLYDLIILKGTPGCGKSTFMRRAAAALEERGLETVYIHCSGDPDSLDGVIAPTIRTAIVDGTAPHVLEPRYALAHLRFIRRVRRALEEEAVASLKRAKRGHDALEALYRPCVDFDAVDALCDAEIARIGAYPV